jgi:hypothetical protein
MGRIKLNLSPEERIEHLKALGRARSKKFYQANKREILKARSTFSKSEKVYKPIIKIELETIVRDKLDEDKPNSTESISNDKEYKYSLETLLKRFADEIPINETKIRDNISIKLATKRAYRNAFKKIFTHIIQIQQGSNVLRKIVKPNFLDKLDNATYGYKEDKKLYSNSTKNVMLTAVLKFITMLKLPTPQQVIETIENRLTLYQTLDNEHKKIRNLNEDYDVENYDDIIDKVVEKYGYESSENMYMQLYKLVPARDDFQLEIQSTRKDALDTNKNYIIIPKTINRAGLIILNQYKTVQRFGKQSTLIPVKIMNLVREIMNKNAMQTGDYLFGNRDQSMYVSNFLRESGVHSVGSKLGIKYLRHSIATSSYRGGNSLEDRIRLSKKMMHSIDTHQSIYIRGFNSK